MPSFELEAGSRLRVQKKLTLYFSQHLQREAGDEVCLHTATQRSKQEKKPQIHALL